MIIRSDRLELIAGNLSLAQAQMDNRAKFAALLDVTIPDEWDFERTAGDTVAYMLNRLQQDETETGWWNWYFVLQSRVGRRFLIGVGGFQGKPLEGTVELGFVVMPTYRRRGYATEATRALVGWAFGAPDVLQVFSQTDRGNIASMRVLEKTGFTCLNPDEDQLYFVLPRSEWKSGKSV